MTAPPTLALFDDVQPMALRGRRLVGPTRPPLGGVLLSCIVLLCFGLPCYTAALCTTAWHTLPCPQPPALPTHEAPLHAESSCRSVCTAWTPPSPPACAASASSTHTVGGCCAQHCRFRKWQPVGVPPSPHCCAAAACSSHACFHTHTCLCACPNPRLPRPAATRCTCL